MRELKFRVWDDFLNDWHATGATTEFIDKCNKGYNFNIVCFGNPERVHIEQYTGLKDKNGKEIYEGDIVKARWCRAKNARLDTMGEVKYDFGWFYIYDDPDGQDRLGVPIHNCYDIEIVGNIHEEEEEE